MQLSCDMARLAATRVLAPTSHAPWPLPKQPQISLRLECGDINVILGSDSTFVNDLTHVLKEDVTEFESLDMAVHMLFLARSHSYDISRAISLAARDAGFDGLIYPSFFSLIRTGGHPFETAYGLSIRRFHPEAEKYAKAFTIENFALFRRPLENLLVRVECINRLVLTQIGYRGHFGPVTY